MNPCKHGWKNTHQLEEIVKNMEKHVAGVVFPTIFIHFFSIEVPFKDPEIQPTT